MSCGDKGGESGKYIKSETGDNGVNGGGDMQAAVYDPKGIKKDAFDAANLHGDRLDIGWSEKNISYAGLKLETDKSFIDNLPQVRQSLMARNSVAGISAFGEVTSRAGIYPHLSEASLDVNTYSEESGDAAITLQAVAGHCRLHFEYNSEGGLGAAIDFNGDFGKDGDVLTRKGATIAWAPPQGGAGGGDMQAAVYDPEGIKADAFDAVNLHGENISLLRHTHGDKGIGTASLSASGVLDDVDSAALKLYVERRSEDETESSAGQISAEAEIDKNNKAFQRLSVAGSEKSSTLVLFTGGDTSFSINSVGNDKQYGLDMVCDSNGIRLALLNDGERNGGEAGDVLMRMGDTIEWGKPSLITMRGMAWDFDWSTGSPVPKVPQPGQVPVATRHGYWDPVDMPLNGQTIRAGTAKWDGMIPIYFDPPFKEECVAIVITQSDIYGPNVLGTKDITKESFRVNHDVSVRTPLNISYIAIGS